MTYWVDGLPFVTGTTTGDQVSWLDGLPFVSTGSGGAGILPILLALYRRWKS